MRDEIDEMLAEISWFGIWFALLAILIVHLAYWAGSFHEHEERPSVMETAGW